MIAGFLRTTRGLFALALLCTAIVVANGGAAPPEPERPGIEPHALYISKQGSLMVRLVPRTTALPLRLAWMDVEGELLASPVEARSGALDLFEVFPSLREMRRVTYVQLMEHDAPIGAAIVVQPILARLVPVTQPAYREDGAVYTRIVGWKHEDELGPPRVDQRNETELEPSGEPGADDEERRERGRPARDLLEDPKRLHSGWRVYVERDVVLRTELGEIRLALRPDAAPNTAWHFRELVRAGFYDGLRFHRVLPLTAAGEPFIIQAGDPSGTGRGGTGQWLPIEPSRIKHDLGVIAMARGDHPDSAGSQFFICLSREGTRLLDGQYCAFGYAVSGRETILEIADTELRDVATGRPANPPRIERAVLVDAPPRMPGRGRPDRRVSEEEPPPPPTGRIPR